MEKDVKKDEWKLCSMTFSAEKEKSDLDFELREAHEKAEIFGEVPDSITRHASQVLTSKLSHLKKDMKTVKHSLDKKPSLLEKAKERLERTY